MKHIAEINISKLMDAVLFSHMTVKGSSLRRPTRRFVSRLSPPLANKCFKQDMKTF